MFSLVDEGIIQIPKSAWLWQTWTDNFLHLTYICIYMVHGLTQSTWQSSQHTTYSAIILWSSYKLTIMINDTVAQSSTDSSAIQIPKYFFKIIFF